MTKKHFSSSIFDTLKKVFGCKKIQAPRQTKYTCLGVPVAIRKYTEDRSKYRLYILGIPFVSVHTYDIVVTKYRVLCFSWKR